MAITFKDLLPAKEMIYGTKCCQGCGAFIAARLAMKVMGEKSILLAPACCFAAVIASYPESCYYGNLAITAFPGLASTAAGTAVAKEALGLPDDIKVVALGGDGGTVDIGLQALSGAAERNDDILYICYDNEAYMNTGVQRSGETPYGSSTTTTPAGKVSKGCDNTFKKSLFEIMAAHRIPYVATASVANPLDYIRKVEKAKNIKGCRVIHVMAPCPTGWGHASELTVDIARRALESGVWYLAECENGKYTVNFTYEQKGFIPVAEYMKGQKRFKHLKEEDFKLIESFRDEDWKRLHRLAEF